jgi:hypothetical protein
MGTEKLNTYKLELPPGSVHESPQTLERAERHVKVAQTVDLTVKEIKLLLTALHEFLSSGTEQTRDDLLINI